jgi:hypothetical protein
MRYLLFACVCVAVSAALPLAAAAAGERGAIACKKGEPSKACKPKVSKRDSTISAEERERNERALQLNVIQSLQNRR